MGNHGFEPWSRAPKARRIPNYPNFPQGWAVYFNPKTIHLCWSHIDVSSIIDQMTRYSSPHVVFCCPWESVVKAISYLRPILKNLSV